MVLSHFNLLSNWACIGKRIPIVYFPIMLLSERLISSLENVLQNSGRCFWKELDETCKGHVYPADAVMSRSSLALIEKIEIPKSTLGPRWVNFSPMFSQMDATPCS